MRTAFLQARIARLELIIEAYEDAVLAISTGKAQEYRLDTGQDGQMVKKIDLQWMATTLDKLYSTLCGLQNRLTGGQTIIVRPLF